MRSLNNNIISGFNVTQNKQDFIVSSFTISQILTFTRYTQRLIIGYDEENIPIYNNDIQRNVENSRVKKIADFLINDPDATFPTNLVLHVPKEVIEEKYEKNEVVSLVLAQKVFTEVRKETGDVFISIIDGQHRIKGIEEAIERLQNQIYSIEKSSREIGSEKIHADLIKYKERLDDLLNIQLVVTFFIDKTLEYQAMIFSTINRTQKKVSASLVSSLFGITDQDTPQKTALQVVLALNGHEKSPFYKRIKLYGAGYKRSESPPLSQAGMVSSIVKNISESLREAENDRFKERKALLKRSSGSNKYLPFRNWYASNKDNLISDSFFYFFNSVKKYFLDDDGVPYWDLIKAKKNILHTTVGYQSLLDIMIEIIKNENITENNVQTIFDVKLQTINVMNLYDNVRYSFNNSGKKILTLELSLRIYPSNSNNDQRILELKNFL